jgi:hypothetical protein
MCAPTIDQWSFCLLKFRLGVDNSMRAGGDDDEKICVHYTSSRFHPNNTPEIQDYVSASFTITTS